MTDFVKSYRSLDGEKSDFVVFSNSVDEYSSVRNLSMSLSDPQLVAFVGIHPQILNQNIKAEKEEYWEPKLRRIANLLQEASGLGEIGLDPKYGRTDMQEYLFARQLELAETRNISVTIHSRDSLDRCLEIISTFSLNRSRLLFHWFAGDLPELKRIQGMGYYVSFGLPILYSKRVQSLLKAADHSLVLAETDSPLPLSSVWNGFVASPFAISSVIFGMGRILGKTFAQVNEQNDENARKYLATQN